MPDWLPEGNKIVHIRYVGIGAPEIYVMDSTGENSKRLTFNNVFDSYPKYSYDGQKIAWTSGNNQNQIWIMNSDGTNQYYLTDGSYPCWSPDNNKIAYSKPINNKVALFIIGIKTRAINQLTF
jgi:dipeptidyl aminopeptidase/acylaminoacyl peptidase